MKFNWSIAHGSRISKIPFAPLRVIALFIRNIFVFVLLLKPDSRNARLVKKLYRDSAQLSLMYIDNARVKGDIGEFGSHGNLAAFIADFLGSEKSVRAYHVFDSFEGYPAEMTEVDAKSPHVKSGVWSPHSCVSPISSTSMLKELRRKHPNTFIHEGYFENTLHTVAFPEGIAIAVLDCNLYASHFYVLDYLFKNKILSEGGVISFADYNVHAASPEFSSRRAWREIVEKYEIKFSDEGAYNWGGRKFIVHSYGTA